jgi:monofunctional biosynthetic peptidoglycan transglycosylase
MNAWLLGIVRLLMLVVISALALQAYFLMRIALMIIVDPQSTTFQRSEMWRMLAEQRRIVWSQQWVPYQRISPHLKRAVIASEDASFADHSGIDWDALEKAWERNLKAEAHAERANGQLERRTARSASVVAPRKVQARLVGGSTITQQLAKNLFLSGERALPRKAQEFVITLMLESVLPKQRILEIYLNNVEWGEGLFGAEAAARHYFHVSASQLGAYPSARLAVMLPAPKRFEKRPGSAYVAGRAATIVARMADVELP